MAEKTEEEGLKSKLGRRLSKRSSARSPETPKINTKPAASKSATLPPNMNAGAMSPPQGSGSGLFSKLKRRFRLGSNKRKYDLASPGGENPPRSRRRSDESQLRQGKEDSFDDDVDGVSGKPSKKPGSAKTPRKTKTDKEEVILIRKDKRVSVICKAENGDAEVLFSNIENSDEDLSIAWDGLEEDPYATLSSVKDEIDKQDLGSSKTKSPSKSSASSRDSKAISPSHRSSVSTPAKTPDSTEDYPYARIDPSKKRSKSLHHETPLRAQDYNLQVRARIKSQVEPDYETLEEVQHRKSELISSPQGSNNNLPANSPSTTDGLNTSQNSLDDLDPDYETLEEIQHKQRALSMHLPQQKLSPDSDSLDVSDPFDPYASLTRPKSYTPGASDRSNRSPSSVSSQKNFSQENKSLSPSQLSQHSPSLASPSSLSPLAPLAVGVDASLPRDQSQELQISVDGQEAEEECLYDNPNVILRKQQQHQQHTSTLLSTLNSGAPQTSPGRGLPLGDTLAAPLIHHHHIKTPAEEELVEKLSSLLAPPLPLRNYQKEEAYQTTSSANKVLVRNGNSKSNNSSSSARHSWSSQNTRHAMSEFLDVASAGSGIAVSPRSQHRWTSRSAEIDRRRHSTHSARDYTWSIGQVSPNTKSKASKKESSRESLASGKEFNHSHDSERVISSCGAVGKDVSPALEESSPHSQVIEPIAFEEPEIFNTEQVTQSNLKTEAAKNLTADPNSSCDNILIERVGDSKSEVPSGFNSSSLVEDTTTGAVESQNSGCYCEVSDTLNTSQPMTVDSSNMPSSLPVPEDINEGPDLAGEPNNPSSRTENSMNSPGYSTTYASVIKQKPQGNNFLNFPIRPESVDDLVTVREEAGFDHLSQSCAAEENRTPSFISSVPQEDLLEDTDELREFCGNFALHVIDRAVKICLQAEQEEMLGESGHRNSWNDGDEMCLMGNCIQDSGNIEGDLNQRSVFPQRGMEAEIKEQEKLRSDAVLKLKKLDLEAGKKGGKFTPLVFSLEDIASSSEESRSNSTSMSKSDDDLQKMAGTPSDDCGILSACLTGADCPKDDDNNMERFRSQGARPKVVPLNLPGECSYSVQAAPHASCSSERAEGATSTQNRRSRSSVNRSESDSSSDSDDDKDERNIEDVLGYPTADTELLDSLGEMDDSSDNFFMGATRDKKQKELIRARNRIRQNPDLNIQETVYVDSDSDGTEDFLAGLEGDRQVWKNNVPGVHNSYVVNVQGDLSVTKFVRPVVYANPRLLENVLSGKFKYDPSIEKDYLPCGVFKKGRFFCYLDRDTWFDVEEKLKAYFHANRNVFVTDDRNLSRRQMRQLQKAMDNFQQKIDKKLDEVKDFQTFRDIRKHLLKTFELDSWVPERTPHKFSLTSPTDTSSEESKEEKNSRRKAKKQSKSSKDGGSKVKKRAKYKKASRDSPCIHAKKPQACNNFQFENTILLEKQRDEELASYDYGSSPRPCPSPGTSMESVLDDFLKLCDRTLACKKCGDQEDSDSEDEKSALDVYVRTVGPRYCRALHGELAYTTHCRRPRECCSPSRASPYSTQVVASEPCQGGPCHLSWQDWCSMDLHFRKLVPHSSPRLDFQFLLKTYAELKHFALKGRKRNPECKGCYLKSFLHPNHLFHGQQDAFPRCSRAEEFVFLKLLRDELAHFGLMAKVSAGARALFVEERDIGHSCLFLLRTILRIIHRMERRFHLVKAIVTDPSSQGMVHELNLMEDHARFHVTNFQRYHADSMLDSLRTWMTPEDYSPDPNILVSGRTVVAHTDSRSTLELAGMLGVAEPQPLQEGEDFLESMQQLRTKEWYWGPISYEEAAMILHDKEDGSFLVRDSSDHKYLLSLSFKSLGEIHHTRMEHAKGLFSFWSQPESHGKARICEFIDKSVQNSRDGRFLYFLRPSARGVPPLPIRLLNPVSRNFRVASLRHLSRFVISQNVRKDHLSQLPVPEKVKRYLKEKQYYVEIPDEEWPFYGDCMKS